MSHPQIICAVSTGADLEDIIALCSPPDCGVLPRKFNILNASVLGGFSLTLRNEQGELIGCSSAFPLCGSAYAEIGGTVIKGPFGFSLYEVFVALHALHIFCCHPCDRFVVGCVSSDRARLLARLTGHMRWVRFNPPIELIQEEESSFASVPPEATWIYLPANAQIHFAKIALEIKQNGIISGRRRETLPIDVTSLPCCCQHGTLLQCLAKLSESDLPDSLGWLEAFQIASASMVQNA